MVYRNMAIIFAVEITVQLSYCLYRIAGKFGEGKVWRIDSFQAFGDRKFGELIDQPIDY